MTQVSYAITRDYNGQFYQAIEAVTKALKDEGFGILTRIDASQVLKEKLGVEYPRYQILGVCNPSRAYQVLKAEREIGLLLPCNIIVYQDGDQVKISAIKPTAALGLTNNQLITKIAGEVEIILTKALDMAVGVK